MSKSPKKLYHVYLFLFGSLYYWIFPLIILSSGILEGMPGVNLLDNYSYQSFESKYLLLVLLITFSFVLGALAPLHYKRKVRKHNHRKVIISDNRENVTRKSIEIIAIPFFILGQFAIFKGRHALFKGYSQTYNVEILGTIATCTCVFLFLYMYILQDKQFGRIRESIGLSSKFFLFALFEFSLVLLGYGSRMYVLIPIVAYAVYYMQRNKLNKKIILTIIVSIIVFLAVGCWRLSSDNFDLKFLLYIGCAEPLFTWISVASYFEYNEIDLLYIPFKFLTSFINLIPTILLPDKSTFIIPFSAVIETPLGAINLLTCLLADFGILGSCLMMFMGGFVLTCIQNNWKSQFGRAYYCCLCGIIPFQLFRDGFSIVNKMIFFNFLILPILILIFSKVIVVYSRNRKTT